MRAGKVAQWVGNLYCMPLSCIQFPASHIVPLSLPGVILSEKSGVILEHHRVWPPNQKLQTKTKNVSFTLTKLFLYHQKQIVSLWIFEYFLLGHSEKLSSPVLEAQEPPKLNPLALWG